MYRIYITYVDEKYMKKKQIIIIKEYYVINV